MLMPDEDAQHFTKPGPKQKANTMFRQVQVKVVKVVIKGSCKYALGF